MKKLTTAQFLAATKALTTVLGSPQYYSLEKQPDRVWLTWGASKDNYPPEDKVQFGAQTDLVVTEAALVDLRIPKEDR